MAARRNTKPRPPAAVQAARQEAETLLAQARDEAEAVRSEAARDAEQATKAAAVRVEEAEAAIVDAEARRDEAVREAARWQGSAEGARRGVEAARRRADRLLAEAREHAGDARRDAEVQAAQAQAAVDRASLEAERLLAAAREQAEASRSVSDEIHQEAEAVRAAAARERQAAVEAASEIRQAAESEARGLVEEAQRIRSGATSGVRGAQQLAAGLREERQQVQATARRWAVTVIAVSTVITVFGSGNAHEVLARHNTPEPWGWFLYPALEAGLIVEIQIGGALAVHGRKVIFWGAALRVVTALAAVTVCVFGPAERGDFGGAVLHAIGPVVQFWLAEFLAAARAQFKKIAEDLESRAVQILQPAPAETASRPKPKPSVSPRQRSHKRRETTQKPPQPPRETGETEAGGETAKPKVSAIGDVDRDREVSQLVQLMKERGGPAAVLLDRDVVPLLSHLSRATCGRRLKSAQELYAKSA